MSLMYDEAIKVATDYLGPAAKRFVDRQIVAHLNKSKPEDLSPEDMPKFVEWVRISLSLLTEEQKTIEECVSRLKAITPAATASSRQ